LKAKVIAAATALAAAGLAVAGCGGTKPATADRGTYLCPGSRTGELLQWRDKDGKLSGTFKDIWMSGQAPTEGITTISSGLSGTLKGTAITLNVGFSHPLRARLDGGHFSLSIPQPNGTAETVTCRPASMADWDKKVAELTSLLNEENNRPMSLLSR
jgi:hypothetical protein